MKALLISIFIIYLGIRFVCATTVIGTLCIEYEKPNLMELIRILIRPCKILGQMFRDEYPISNYEYNPEKQIKIWEQKIKDYKFEIRTLEKEIEETKKQLKKEN